MSQAKVFIALLGLYHCISQLCPCAQFLKCLCHASGRKSRQGVCNLSTFSSASHGEVEPTNIQSASPSVFLVFCELSLCMLI